MRSKILAIIYMAVTFCCPECKNIVVEDIDNSYKCKNCQRHFFYRDGFFDFLGDVNFYAGEVSQLEMRLLIKNIDSLGYENALMQFFQQNSRLQDYILDSRRADWISHCISSNTSRCLDIGSGLGNISELLSSTYDEVYSLEPVRERIEFQKRRYKWSGRTNIVMVRSNALKLPFQDNYFDLVVCNGMMEWIGMLNVNLHPREAQLSFLREIRRVLGINACLYIGIENRFGLPFLLGAKDHSGLPYTSLLPRKLANLIVRKFGRPGGIYGDTSGNQKEKRGYYTYTYSILGYNSLLKEAGYNFKSFWVFPSYNNPNWSGRLDDKIGLKGFVRYLTSTNTSRYRLVLSMLERLDKSVLGLFASLFAPSFLFYCYKNELVQSLADLIFTDTGLNNYTTLGDGSDITYLLYDKSANPRKVVHLKRGKYHLPGIVQSYNKTRPVEHKRSESVWSEDWIPGKKLNPLKPNEANMAIKWLIDFQNKNRLTVMTKRDLLLEVNSLRENLIRVPSVSTPGSMRFIDDYESYLGSHDVIKTPEHGDFWYGNILIDRERKINVIDWEHFRKIGDPFFDFVFFIVNAMLSPSRTLHEFRSNVYKSGKFSPILTELQTKINDHFAFDLNLDILIPYTLLRFIIRQELETGRFNNTAAMYKNMLAIFYNRNKPILDNTE